MMPNPIVKLDEGRISAAMILDQFREGLWECCHGLAGFPKRSSKEIALTGRGLMDRNIPLDEILATNAYAMMLNNICSALWKKAPVPYDKVFSFPMSSRLDLWSDYPDIHVNGQLLEDNLGGEFAALAVDGRLDRHALPMAFLWANGQLAENGCKPFTIDDDFFPFLLDAVANGDCSRLSGLFWDSMRKCREIESEEASESLTKRQRSSA